MVLKQSVLIATLLSLSCSSAPESDGPSLPASPPPLETRVASREFIPWTKMMGFFVNGNDGFVYGAGYDFYGADAQGHVFDYRPQAFLKQYLAEKEVLLVEGPEIDVVVLKEKSNRWGIPRQCVRFVPQNPQATFVLEQVRIMAESERRYSSCNESI